MKNKAYIFNNNLMYKYMSSWKDLLEPLSVVELHISVKVFSSTYFIITKIKRNETYRS